MATRRTNRSLTWGQIILFLGIGGLYPATKAFAAGLPIFGAVSLAFAVTCTVAGWRLFRRGQAQEPGNTMRTYDHRENRHPESGTGSEGSPEDEPQDRGN